MNRWNGNTDERRRRRPDPGPAAAADTRGCGDGDAEDCAVQPGEPRRLRRFSGVAELPGAVPADRSAPEAFSISSALPGRPADLPPVVRARRVRLRRDADQRGQPPGLQGADARLAAEEAGQD